jgi:hypothetical protein
VSELYLITKGFGRFVGILEDQWTWLERIIIFTIQQNRVMWWIADFLKRPMGLLELVI